MGSTAAIVNATEVVILVEIAGTIEEYQNVAVALKLGLRQLLQCHLPRCTLNVTAEAGSVLLTVTATDSATPSSIESAARAMAAADLSDLSTILEQQCRAALNLSEACALVEAPIIQSAATVQASVFQPAQSPLPPSSPPLPGPFSPPTEAASKRPPPPHSPFPQPPSAPPVDPSIEAAVVVAAVVAPVLLIAFGALCFYQQRKGRGQRETAFDPIPPAFEFSGFKLRRESERAEMQSEDWLWQPGDIRTSWAASDLLGKGSPAGQLRRSGHLSKGGLCRLRGLRNNMPWVTCLYKQGPLGTSTALRAKEIMLVGRIAVSLRPNAQCGQTQTIGIDCAASGAH